MRSSISHRLRQVDERARHGHARGVRRRLADRFGVAVGGAFTLDKQLALDPALRARLTREFAPDVEELGRIIGRDLSGWVAAPSEPTRAA